MAHARGRRGRDEGGEEGEVGEEDAEGGGGCVPGYVGGWSWTWTWVDGGSRSAEDQGVRDDVGD